MTVGCDRQLTTVVQVSNFGDWQRLETEGLAYLTFWVGVFRWQFEKKRGFLHEHSHLIMDKQTDEKTMCSGSDTTMTRCDMCMFGDVTWHRTGNTWEKRPSQRRTGWVTNVLELAETLSAICRGEHDHSNVADQINAMIRGEVKGSHLKHWKTMSPPAGKLGKRRMATVGNVNSVSCSRE